MRSPVAAVAGLAVATLAVATLAVTPAGAQVARFTTSQDTLMPDARTVRVESGHLPGDGLVIVRAVRGGRIVPAPLGQVAIGPGPFGDLRVHLTRPVRAGETLVVMLHADQGRRGVYDGDPMVLSVDVPASVVARAASRG